MALIEEKVKSLPRLRHQYKNVRAAIFIDIVDLGADCSRPFCEKMFLELAAGQIFKPGYAPQPVAKLADDKIFPPVTIQISEGRVGWTTQIAENFTDLHVIRHWSEPEQFAFGFIRGRQSPYQC